MKVDGLIVIFGMAMVTFACRIGGFWLMNHSKSLKPLERILKHTPGSIIAAIVAPAALLNGFDDALAAVVVGLVMIRSRNLLLSMSSGVAVVLVLRYFF
jgi:uncharacterized membrane protein